MSKLVPKTFWEKVAFVWREFKSCFRVAVAIASLGAVAGCKSENTGVSARVGDITAFPEISDAEDNVSVKILYIMTGASVWTAKDSNVTVRYKNNYTNDYLGVFHTRGVQDLEVEVEPVESGAEDGK